MRLAVLSRTKGSICQSLLWCLGGLHCPCDKLSIALKVYTVTDGKVVSGLVALVQLFIWELQSFQTLKNL